MKKIVLSLGLALFATQAHAAKTKTFTCETLLNHTVVVDGQEQTTYVPLKITGQRSATNTLVGGVWVQAGNFSFDLLSPKTFLSENVVQIHGKNNQEQASLYFVYMNNNDGSENDSNYARVSVVVKGKVYQIDSGKNNVKCLIQK